MTKEDETDDETDDRKTIKFQEIGNDNDQKWPGHLSFDEQKDLKILTFGTWTFWVIIGLITIAAIQLHVPYWFSKELTAEQFKSLISTTETIFDFAKTSLLGMTMLILGNYFGGKNKDS